jgi:acyl-coenzyme A thioesterase PaaI-like protein
MNERRTHLAIDTTLCGDVVELNDGHAVLELIPDERMAADDRGLVHGSFPFGLLDHAAMLAVNEPTVVIANAQLKFTAPAVVGQRLVAEARVTATDGKKRTVEGLVKHGETVVLSGEMLCFVPDEHVLGPQSDG